MTQHQAVDDGVSEASERFWSKVDRRGSGECWSWTCGFSSNGYGWHRGHRAHRVAYELTNGAIPAGLYVLHSCDNRACVNPAHLRLGTHQDNMDDMVAKGRSGRVTGMWRGENSPAAKLTWETADEIRRLRGVCTQPELARRFGVGQTTISAVQLGKKWVRLEQGQ